MSIKKLLSIFSRKSKSIAPDKHLKVSLSPDEVDWILGMISDIPFDPLLGCDKVILSRLTRKLKGHGREY